MSRLAEAKVGDEVYVRGNDERHRAHGPRRVRIARIGSKYAYIEGDPVGYSLKTGRRNDRLGNDWLETDDDRAYRARVADAEKQLRAFGVTFEPWVQPDRRLAIFDAVRPLMEPEPESESKVSP